jgi:hypothetical protein
MAEGDMFTLPETISLEFVNEEDYVNKGYSAADKWEGNTYFTMPRHTFEEAQEDLKQVQNTVCILKLADDTISKVQGGPTKRRSFEEAGTKHQKMYNLEEVGDLLEKIDDLE